MDGDRVSSLSKADTLEKMGEFWDAHDFTDYDTDAPDVEFKVTCAVPNSQCISTSKNRHSLLNVKMKASPVLA